MFRLIYFISLVQILIFHAVILESKSFSENRNAEQSNQEEPNEAIPARAIILNTEESTESISESEDSNFLSRLETRGGGLCFRLYNCCIKVPQCEDDKPPPRRWTSLPNEYDANGKLIPYWQTEAYKQQRASFRKPPPKPKTGREKVRDTLNEVEPGLHFVACCCLAHCCDSDSD